MKVAKFTGKKWDATANAAKKAAKDKIKADANPNAKDLTVALGLRPTK